MILRTQNHLSGCLIFLIFLLLDGSPLLAQETQTPQDTLPTSDFLAVKDTLVLPDTNHLVMVFAGDIMGHDGQINGAYDETTGKYNYEPTFRYIKDYISYADIAIGNFEVTLAGPPYKGYPQFSSPDELAIESKIAGFDIMAMANNHALDGGQKGFLRTLMMMDSLKFFHMGTYRDSAERAIFYPLVINKNNFRIALLNYTYGTNGLTIPLPYVINRIDTAQIKADIEKVKLTNPDFIIAFMHWGVEYERVENKRQRELATFIFRQGVDIIIGSHPHVVQPIHYVQLPGDSSKSYPVVYSLGNFVSNQRDQYRDGGIVAELHLSKTDSTRTIDSLNYLPYWVWKNPKPNGRYTFYVLPLGQFETAPTTFPLSKEDILLLERYAGDTRKHMELSNESGYYQNKKKLQ